MSATSLEKRFLVAGVADPRPVMVIGGAGFIGSNLAHALLSMDQPVRVLDNLSRPGVERNLTWLQRTHGDLLDVVIADVADRPALRRAMSGVSAVFHLAAQVAVTTSLEDPVGDFEINLRGTLNVLEALRAQDEPPPLLFTSTNKVYGGLEDVGLVESEKRYQPRDPVVRLHGIDERRPLCMRSPYGCSKGGADQYVLDYAGTFGLRTLVFRMSCIYGPHQFGNEEQGWVAHFALRALEGGRVTLYGDGKQVRDVLFVSDLVDAFVRAMRDIGRLSGRAFNIGGGPLRAVSLREVVAMLESLVAAPIETRVAAWRPGDQPYYVSDTRAFEVATGWRPQIGVRTGLTALCDWLREHHASVARAAGQGPSGPASRADTRHARDTPGAMAT